MNKFILGSITAMSLMAFADEVQGGHVNPLLHVSDAPFQAIPFDKISTDDYENAILEGIRLHNEELDKIANATDAPTFENTVGSPRSLRTPA